jgi:hypothetical protein
MKVAYFAKDSVDASLFQAKLSSEGISSFLKGDGLEHALGEVSFNQLIQVCVSDEDLQKAKELLADYEQKANTVEPGPARGKQLAWAVLIVIAVFLFALYLAV